MILGKNIKLSIVYQIDQLPLSEYIFN